MVIKFIVVANIEIPPEEIGELSDIKRHIHWLVREGLPSIKNGYVKIAVPINEDIDIDIFSKYKITKKATECDDEYTLWKIIGKKYTKIKTLFEGVW